MIEDRRFEIEDIARTDFRTSRPGDTANTALLKPLGLSYRYQAARLAISRSLSITTPPPPLPNVDGKRIKGETLFGAERDEAALWYALIAAHADAATLGRREFQDLVAAHWGRGATLLWDRVRPTGATLADVIEAELARHG